MMELHLKIAGTLLVLLALLHIAFPRYFRWRSELAPLGLLSRQMMYVHMFFVALMMLLMGVLCITCAADIIATPLGHKIGFGLFIFWCTRLVFQLFVYSPALWRGKRFETMIHIVFTLLWAYLSGVFLLCWYAPA